MSDTHRRAGTLLILCPVRMPGVLVAGDDRDIAAKEFFDRGGSEDVVVWPVKVRNGIRTMTKSCPASVMVAPRAAAFAP